MRHRCLLSIKFWCVMASEAQKMVSPLEHNQRRVINLKCLQRGRGTS